MIHNFTVIFLIIIFLVFIKSDSKELLTMDGVLAAEDPFTNLMCVTDSNNEHVFKIGQINGLNTITRLYNPLTQKLTVKIDFVDDGDNVECTPPTFSKYIRNKMVDRKAHPDTNTVLLNNKIYQRTSTDSRSSWQTEECRKAQLNNSDHWCGKIYNSITTTPLCIKTSQVQTLPGYCSLFNKVKMFKDTSTDESQDIKYNYLKNTGKPCNQQCLAKSGRLPQHLIDNDSDKIICLKDMQQEFSPLNLTNRTGTKYKEPIPPPTTGLTKVTNERDCIGTPLFKLKGTDIIPNFDETRERSAARPYTTQELTLVNDYWTQPYNKCYNSCTTSTFDIIQ